MKLTNVYSTTFRAIHLSDYPGCPTREHSHEWVARIAVGGGPDPKTGRLSVDPIPFLRVIDELRNENLNKLLPGTFPTPEYLATYVAERIRMITPGLESVTVEMDDIASTVSF